VVADGTAARPPAQDGTDGSAAAGAPRVRPGTPLWQPSAGRVQRAAVTTYRDWLTEELGLHLADEAALWQWSVTESGQFWQSIWEFCAVEGDRGAGPALADARMPGADWFPGARVNYAENALSRRGPAPAVIGVREDGATAVVSWDELRRQVARAAAGLRSLGVTEGDRVCAVLPNTVYAVVAMLATASVGASWSSCSPELDAQALSARLAPLSPKVLLGVDGFTRRGRSYDALGALAGLAADLPRLAATVIVPYLSSDAFARARAAGLPGLLTWDELMAAEAADGEFTRVAFGAPLWILHSPDAAGAGAPGPVVHGHGGILLEHLKALALHLDLGPDDRFCWYTPTGEMTWHLLVSGLLVGATVVLYDGATGYPTLGTQFGLAEALEVTCLGTSADYLAACRDAGLVPRADADLSLLRTLGSLGSPLAADTCAWVYEAVSPDIFLAPMSGGADVCTAVVAGLPTQPVRAGEIGSRALGCAVSVYDAEGKELVDEVGDLVITAPLPSMPLFVWGDPEGSRLREACFSAHPGVWRAGGRLQVLGDGAVILADPGGARVPWAHDKAGSPLPTSEDPAS
jgi:acetoacetyl-CoA synthetase